MRPAAQSGALLHYVRHRTDPICFFNYILTKAFFDYI
jgi:hypothetical protein